MIGGEGLYGERKKRCQERFSVMPPINNHFGKEFPMTRNARRLMPSVLLLMLLPVL